MAVGGRLFVQYRRAQEFLRSTAPMRAAYEQFLAANLCQFSIELEDEQSFRVEATAYSHEAITLARVITRRAGESGSRRQSEIQRDSSPRYGIYVPLAGNHEIDHAGTTTTLGPNSLLLFSGTEEFIYRKSEGADALYLLVPKAFLDRRFSRIEGFCGQLNPPEGIRHLLIGTIRALHGGAGGMDPEEFGVAVQMATNLIYMTIEKSADFSESVTPVRAANLAKVKRIIKGRCLDSGLTLAAIADESGLSLRYLHYLFRDEGCTVGEYLMQKRLENAYRLLAIGAPTVTRVTDVCFASGFSNLSHFSAAFRRTYSCTPRDVLMGRN